MSHRRSSDASNASAAGPGGDLRGAAAGREPRWWRLVWCYERCFLPECEERRRSLSEAARGHGAALICLKRAARLQCWIEERERCGRPRRGAVGGAAAWDEEAAPVPYVLMTEQRQAASCMEAWLQREQKHHPAFTVILCDSSQQLDSLLPLAQRLSQKSPVYLCTELGSPTAFITHVAQQLLGGNGHGALPEGRRLNSTALAQVQQPQLQLWWPTPAGEQATERRSEQSRRVVQGRQKGRPPYLHALADSSPEEACKLSPQQPQGQKPGRQQGQAGQQQQQEEAAQQQAQRSSPWALSPLTPLPRPGRGQGEEILDASQMTGTAVAPAALAAPSPVGSGMQADTVAVASVPDAVSSVAATASAVWFNAPVGLPVHATMPTVALPAAAVRSPPYNLLQPRLCPQPMLQMELVEQLLLQQQMLQQRQAFQQSYFPVYPTHPETSVEYLLGPIHACGETEVDRMLRAAMPESYHD